MRSSRLSSRSIRPGIIARLPLEPGAVVVVGGYAPAARKFAGYFFAETSHFEDIQPSAAIEVLICSDEGVRSLSWPIVGDIGASAVANWPLPLFRYNDTIRGLICADRVDPVTLELLERSPVALDEAPDRLGASHGHIAAESRVAKTLKHRTPQLQRKNP